MKIKTSLLILALAMLTLSCKRPDLDLAELKLPANPKTLLDRFDHKLDFIMEDFTSYKSKDPDLMWYRGDSLSGSMRDDDKSSFFAANFVSFYIDKATQQITAYEIHTETQEKTAQLESALQEQLGKPDYYYRDKSFSSRVWERDNRFFLFSTNSTLVIMGEKTRTGDLKVISGSNSKLLSWFSSGGGFSYYGDYLMERAKPEHQGRQYRYTDFFHQEEAEAKSWGREHSMYFDEYVAQ